MLELRESDTFRIWRERLAEKRTRIAVAARLDRLIQGHPGDAKPVGDGIRELRIHYGPGYRIYYQYRGSTIILLLCGGDKSTQTKDIATAKRVAKDWSKHHG